MKKLLLVTLFISLLTTTSCKKENNVTPAVLEGKYNLKSVDFKITFNISPETDEESVNYSNGTITFGANNSLETNFTFLGFDEDEPFAVGSTYSSEYSIDGNSLTMKIKDSKSGTMLPFRTEITTNEGNSLKLKATKSDLLVLAKARDEISGETNNETLFNVFIKTLDMTINLTK